MMKYIFIYISLFFNQVSIQPTSNPLIYPEMDQLIISTYFYMVEQDLTNAREGMTRLKEVWNAISIDVQQIAKSPSCDIIEDQHFLITQIEGSLDKERFRNAANFLDHFYLNLADLRDYESFVYPLDHLWRAKFKYQELKNTVDDPMMDLKEWFEFQDQIDDFQCAWEEYELLYQNLISIYFPDFDTPKQEELHQKMHECIGDLLTSTKTGYRSDFVIPCHKIEEVIHQSLRLYLVQLNTDL